VVEVVEPKDGTSTPTFRMTRYMFHLDSSRDPTLSGVELEHSLFDGGTFTGTPVRTDIECSDFGSTTGFCGYLTTNGANVNFFSGTDAHPSGHVLWYGAKPTTATDKSGGTCPSGTSTQCVAEHSTPASSWITNGNHYAYTTTTSANMGTIVNRSSHTIWTGSLDDIYTERIVYDGSEPTPPQSDGSTVIHEWHENNTTTGFLNGTLVWDSPSHTYLLNCRYPDGAGSAAHSLNFSDAEFSAPPTTPCATYFPSWPPTINVTGIGGNSDYFAHDYTAQNAQLTTAQWITGASGSVADLPWKAFNVTRDASTGLIATSKATDSMTTSYTYDGLGRIIKIAPPGGETATFVCYDLPNQLPTQTTAYRATSQLTCPVSPGASTLTWHQYQYDGLGRLIREYKLQPDLTQVKRFTKYDAAGNAYFHSEWVTSATSEMLTIGTGETVNSCSENVPAAAPGTFQFCYDPLGRPQGSVGPKFSSYVTMVRTDGTTVDSDTKETTTVACVNGTWSGTTCTGGTSAVTITLKDALGRVTQVNEPSGDVTTYTYNVQDKLAGVAQGVQSRTLAYNAFGFLKSEATPEQGTATYVYGSLGNLREKAEGSGTNFIDSTYEPAGRLAKTCAGGASDLTCTTAAPYASNSYDTACTTGAQPGCGKLAQSTGSNYPLDPGPAVTETFTYSSTDGRLSSKTTAVGTDSDANDGVGVRDGESISAAESWTYTNLGLLLNHNLPRTSGTYAIGYTYGTDLPVTVTAAGVNKASTVLYNPASALKQWISGGGGISGGNVTTAIGFDSSIPGRPTSIATSNASPNLNSGTYVYDGAGDIMSMTVDANNADTFAYDNRSRLTNASYKVVGATSSQGFTYDRYGNLTSVTGANARTLTTSTTTNQLTSGQTYDARGNMTSQAGFNGFDGLDRITNSFGWDYLYSASGERVAKFPDTPILRREMAKVIVQARGEQPLSTGCTGAVDSYFTADVACSDPDRLWIDQVHADGIASGYGGGVYGPQNSVTRGEMSAFLARGKLAPNPVPMTGTVNGFNYVCVPPGQSGGSSYFADVAPNDIFCPTIHYIAVIGITAGCASNPPRFCPGDVTPETQMMAFTRRGWPNFFYVPRGTIYTFRDASNRVATEMMSKPGSTSYPTNDFPVATTVTRDNVFLGNLLVASNAAANGLGGTPGWSYYFSDHLGTPRLISGAESSSPKYWPYGDEVTGTPITSERLKFAAMERDVENTHFYDHARSHDFNLGRFVSVDKAGAGSPKDPMSWNRYAYARDNPIKVVDRNGLWWSLANSESQRAFIYNALVHDVMKPTYRADFLRIANSPREVRLTSGHLSGNGSIAFARPGDIVSVHAGDTGIVAGTSGKTVQTTLDVGAIQSGAKFTTGLNPGAIDPTGQTTVAHETYHVDTLLFGTQADYENGDKKTSQTGPAQQFGETVFNEQADRTEDEARAIVDQNLNKPPGGNCGQNGQTSEGGPCKY
jgi:RHS repeat-associated protein